MTASRTVTAEIDDTPLVERIDGVQRAASDAGQTAARALAQGEALQARLDALARAEAERIVDFERRIAALKTPTPCQVNVVDAGCRMNDGEFDNTPPLMALFERMAASWPVGSNEFLNTKIYIPAGALCLRTPLTLPHRSGLKITGNGGGQAVHENAYWGPSLKKGVPGGPASRLVYLGPADQPAITMRGSGTVLDGLMLQDGFVGNPPMNVKPRPGSLGVRVTGEKQPGTGQHRWLNLHFVNFETGFDVVGETHGDTTVVDQLWTTNVPLVGRFDNPQAVGWHFGLVDVGWGNRTVFEFVRGGRSSIDHLAIMSPSLVFKIHKPMVNYSAFKIGFLEADCGGNPGWRLVETVGKGYCIQLTVEAGMLSHAARPGPNPIQITDVPPAAQDVYVRLLDSATCRPWEYNVTPAAERK